MSEHELHWPDEILQVMYWMRGENLGQEATLEQLNRFLHLEPVQLQAALQQLLALRLIRAQADHADGSTSYALTERGIAEGKRRFLDEFSSYLTYSRASQFSLLPPFRKGGMGGCLPKGGTEPIHRKLNDPDLQSALLLFRQLCA